MKKRNYLIFMILLALSILKGQAQVRPLVICVVTEISPTTLNAYASAGQVSPSVGVTTQNPSCTNYTVSENYDWISYSKNGHTVTITVTANTGPARTGYVEIGDQTLTVNQACGNYPTAPTSASSDRNNFCADDAGNISLSASGGSGTTLRWLTGSCGGTSIGTGTPLVIASPTSTTTYYVRWESCGTSTCASVTVTVNPLPSSPISASSDRNNFCANDGGNISLSVSGGSGSTLRWFTGSCGGTSIGTGTPLVIASPTVTTTYYVRWENNCGNSTCVNVTVQQIQMYRGQIGYNRKVLYIMMILQCWLVCHLLQAEVDLSVINGRNQ
jgi:hypothetical protein